MPRIAGTELDVHALCLGGNVFGWTADREASFAVLDAYRAAGGNFIDTADVYSAWVEGHRGGESETVIGEWMASRGARDETIVATKVGMAAGADNLAPATIRRAVEGSLERLGTDRIDIYYAHRDDPDTPLADTLGAFDELVRAGTVRWIAASNYSAPRLAEALEISGREGLASYVALQPKYNLVDRGGFEGDLSDLCARAGVACVPYSALASGFLSGKYRANAPPVDSPRARGASGHLDDRGRAVLEALDRISAERDAPVAAVALAWLAAQPTVVAPIASARSTEQLADLLAFTDLQLSEAERETLAAASAPD